MLSGTGTHTICGTPQYIAPEVYSSDSGDGYGTKADMWSAGILLYFILSGTHAFSEDNIYSVKEKILQGGLEFSGRVWKYISDGVKSLIQGLLHINPAKRWSAARALKYLDEEVDLEEFKPKNASGLLKKRISFDCSPSPPKKKQKSEIEIVDLLEDDSLESIHELVDLINT